MWSVFGNAELFFSNQCVLASKTVRSALIHKIHALLLIPVDSRHESGQSLIFLSFQLVLFSLYIQLYLYSHAEKLDIQASWEP